MLQKLTVENFRSLESAEVEFAPITVLFGATSSGKSSLFYALLALRNFILNPNQSVDAFFNLGFQNLGGFDACVFNHVSSKAMKFSALFAGAEGNGRYGIDLRKTDAELSAAIESVRLSTTVPIPYGLNQTTPFSYTEDNDEEFAINWNGIAATVSPKAPDAASQARSAVLAKQLNAPAENLKRVDICPHRRGFFKPNYTVVPLTPTPTSEDEVASLIINDQHSPSRISIDTVDIFGRDFRTFTPQGTATTFLQTTEIAGARVPALLVNDGFGVNQVIYMLAKIHRPEVETVLVEEPEVHLHPTIVRKFAQIMTRIVAEDEKQLIFTTHSEQFLLSMLACVKQGALAPDDLACYHVSRDKKRTVFTRERVNSNGQISGGLASFMEGELEDIKTFLSPRG